MKKLKEPEQWNYPRLYMAVNEHGDIDDALRIIYPSGRGDWLCVEEDFDPKHDFACWAAVNGVIGRSDSSSETFKPVLAERSRKQMFNYLKKINLKPVFIGEIK